MDILGETATGKALAVELVEQHESACVAGNHAHQPARLGQAGLLDQAFAEQRERLLQLLDAFPLQLQASPVEAVALEQMILEYAVGPDAEAGTLP
ncbi:hypothetical protein D9M71_748170 [compost metagenome]